MIAERWILARLRNRIFFSLAELNAAIRELVDHLNQKPFKKMPGTRLSLFQEIERAALRPLPPTAYEFALWPTARVNIDYHLEVDRHNYSVPYRHVGELCDVRLTASMRLGKHYGSERLEAACKRTLTVRAFSYRSVESILRHPLPDQPRVRPHRLHENLRGPHYYE